MSFSLVFFGHGTEAAAEVLLQVRLADHEDGAHDEVPERRGDEAGHDLEAPLAEVVGLEIELADDRNGDEERGVLDHGDRLVAGRRDDDSHGLREHDPPHRLAGTHPQCLGRLGLAPVDREDAGAGDLGHVGGLGEAEAKDPDPDGAGEGVPVEGEEGEGPVSMPMRPAICSPNGTPMLRLG
jgi:hypothetical protein